MIEVEDLIKNYGSLQALAGVSFRVGKGEVVGFVGPNGAGKSTTLRIMTGFIGATSGKVRIAGHDIEKAPLEAKQSLGYMPETAPLYPELRVSEYLRFRARLKQVPGKTHESAIRRAMERAGVSDVRESVIGTLSKGYRQRVALADALVADPPLLILDEPTAGLDPNQIREVRRLLRELASTHTILLSSHILSEVESTCDRALVIHKGKLVLEGSLSELHEQQLSAVVELRDPQARAADLLQNLSYVDGCETLREDGDTRSLRVRLARAEDASGFERLVRALVEAGLGVQRLERDRPKLEDVFSELTESRGAPRRRDEANTA